VTIGVLGFTGGFSRRRTEIKRTRKLRWVRRQLERSGEIGSIDDPKKYFAGRITMHYDAFDMVSPPVMYLIGETERTIVALGGSLKHVPGREDVKPREGAKQILSEVQVARAVRRAQLEGSPRLVTPATLHNPAHFEGNPLLRNDAEFNVHPSDEQWAVDIAETLWRWPPGIPPITFETLAERDDFIPTPAEIASRTQKNILVGSPIFVVKSE
jgi:hypothetical protein